MATVNLSNLAYTIPATQGNNYPREFMVYNTSTGALNNGGQCCAWTVPSNASWVTFEIWGGGGGGAGSCCCQSGSGAGAGAYAVQTVNLTTYAGCVYTICAASSTCITPGTGGYGGNTTWVQGPGLSNFCATGGSIGCTQCFMFQNCYICNIAHGSHCLSAFYGASYGIAGTGGSNINVINCYQFGQQFASLAPATASGPQIGPSGCVNGGCSCMPCAYFPGGGGLSAQSQNNNCWCGQWGAGGLVSVTWG